MPSQTFLNLSNKKRNHLITVAIDEFSRVPIADASINQIVKNAGISRGSFYNYFNSKEDIFDYILMLFQTEIKKELNKALFEFNGDVFILYENLYSIIIDQITDKLYSGFFKNALKHFRVYLEDERDNMPGKVKWKDILLSIIPHIDKTNINFQTNEELRLILSLLSAVTMFSVNVTIHEHLTKEEGKRLFKKRLELIKRGLLKDKGGIK